MNCQEWNGNDGGVKQGRYLYRERGREQLSMLLDEVGGRHPMKAK